MKIKMNGTKKLRSLKGKLISIITPAWNESDNLEELCNQIIYFVKKKLNNYEIIIVENGSSDNSFELLKKINKENHRIKYIKLTRNFGYYGGLIAGMENSKGDIVITMDADLQHPPKLIPDMIKKWEDGYNIVGTKKITNKQNSFLRNNANFVYYKILQILSGIPIENHNSDFRLFDKKALQTLISLPEKQKYLRGLSSWIGYKSAIIPFTAPLRIAGKTKFNLIGLISVAISGILSFSIIPLRLISFLGLFISIICSLITLYTFVDWYFVLSNEPPAGWMTLLVGIYFIGGIQLMSIGLLGEYLGQTLTETRKRPSYIIEETNLK